MECGRSARKGDGIGCPNLPGKFTLEGIDLRPDLVLANYQSPGLPDTAHYDTVPLCPDVGHLAGVRLAERWARLLRAPLVEGWRRDEARLLGS